MDLINERDIGDEKNDNSFSSNILNGSFETVNDSSLTDLPNFYSKSISSFVINNKLPLEYQAYFSEYENINYDMIERIQQACNSHADISHQIMLAMSKKMSLGRVRLHLLMEMSRMPIPRENKKENIGEDGCDRKKRDDKRKLSHDYQSKSSPSTSTTLPSNQRHSHRHNQHQQQQQRRH